MINVNNVSLNFNDNTILHNINCIIPSGRITSFVGLSGSGKTALLKCITTLYKNYTGSITLHGSEIKDLSPTARVQALGIVFQHFNLFPHMTVLENCMHPLLTVLKMKKREAEEKAKNELASLGLIKELNYYPDQLSGGQQQRVAIARTMSMNPEVLLFDEPTSALDPQNSKALQQLLLQMVTNGTTIVITSHDMTLIKGLLDTIYFFDRGIIVESYDKNKDELSHKKKISEFLNY